MLVVGPLALTISAFFFLPLPTFQLAGYIEATIQVLIFVLAFMISYKIFTAEDSDIKKFMKQLRASFGKSDIHTNDDVEAGGAIFAEVAKKMTNPNTYRAVQ